LITPQWVGEDGVQAVVILAIDDMRDPKKYEAFLTPILNRLKKIDGRAPLSIMTNKVNPNDPQLQSWLKEGLSLETHTIDHPCPLLAGGDLNKAKSTYDRCVDLMSAIPGNQPVAFRMPCCDSMNSLSPRFFTEIFNKTTPNKKFLTVDSSVFNLITSNDPDLPRELVIDPDGQDKFHKYIPYDRSFVNTIENYPYPYIIGRLCWEFPCVVPSDWEANHYHKPNNPVTVRDLKAALDAVVLKKGTFNLVFHPHGWIRNDQIVDLIDHAVAKHGKKVKFLSFREAQERLTEHLLGGQPLRATDGGDNGVRLLDLNNDGYLDVVIGNRNVRQTRLWSPKTNSWIIGDFPVPLVDVNESGDRWETGVRFGVIRPDGHATLLVRSKLAEAKIDGAWHYDDDNWVKDSALLTGLELAGRPVFTSLDKLDCGVRLRDLDKDGKCELIVCNDQQNVIFSWSSEANSWVKLPFALPSGTRIVNADGKDAGLRFMDVDEDAHEDVIFSNDESYSIHLFDSMEKGWARKALAGKRGDKNEIPLISRHGTNNGVWFHSRQLWVQNEHTAMLKDRVDRRSFNQLLEKIEPVAKSAEVSLHSVRTRPGFEVELMAAEPLVQSPIAFAWGPDGKLWVVEMGDYPLGLDGKGKPGGRIKFLEDTHGDGKYDKATVFLDKLEFPTGVLPWGKGVLVTCAPEIFYAEDTDGDGKADVRKPLYVGFTKGNPQHRVNTLAWGLDNWIYCANGDSGGGVKSLKTGSVLNIRGRDVRIKPDEGLIEAESGQTQFGRCRDDWGNWFGCNNSNPMYHYALADHYLRRNPHVASPDPRVNVSVVPGASPVFPVSRTLPRFNDLWAANHFTSACSAILYRDDLFGPHFVDNSFVSEPVHNLVHRELMAPNGVTFSSRRAVDEQQSEFLASSDNWFRPTTIQTGPDGALWIADMYRQVIEHPEWIPRDWQKRLNLRAGEDKGRIYRVYPAGSRPRPIPRLDRLDTAGLVAALDSPNGWQRDTVQQMLIRRRDRSAVPLLEKLVLDNGRPLCRLHALCSLDGLAELKPDIIKRALADTHPGVRKHTIRLCETRFALSPELGPAILKLLHDADPQVQMQLAFTLGAWNDPRAGETLGELILAKPDEPFLTAAALSSVTNKNIDTLLQSVLRGDKTRLRSELMEKLLGLANVLGNTQSLTPLITHVTTPQGGKYAAWQFAALAGLLDALDQQSSSLAKLALRSNGELHDAVKQLTGIFDAARTAAAQRQSSEEELLHAVRLLGRGLEHQEEDADLLATLLTPQTAEGVQNAALTGLGRLKSGRVPELLLRGWKSYGPVLRSNVLDTLFLREDWLKAVLDAVEHKQILGLDIDAARRQRLLEHKTAAVRERAARLLLGTIDPDRQKVVDAHQPVLGLHGDASTGAEVFRKTCASCHQLGGIGHVVGPDLASLGDKSPESILIAVLDPNRAVEARYINYMAVTKSGLTLTGVLAGETGNNVTLVGPEGKKQVILRTDLEELVSTNKSAMPEGLEKDLTHQNLADLIAFVRTGMPATLPRAVEGNEPQVIRPVADGSLHLAASKCEIYGSNLIFEKQYSNLGFWRSEDDRAVWSLEVSRPGRYAVWLDWACADRTAGNNYLLRVGLNELTGKVKGTGTWDDYRQEKIGEVNLAAGRLQLVFRSAGRIRTFLIDLKSIKLVPVKEGK
jgi:putative membrane-bound dehydrogenase-like protein